MTAPRRFEGGFAELWLYIRDILLCHLVSPCETHPGWNSSTGEKGMQWCGWDSGLCLYRRISTCCLFHSCFILSYLMGKAGTTIHCLDILWYKTSVSHFYYYSRWDSLGTHHTHTEIQLLKGYVLCRLLLVICVIYPFSKQAMLQGLYPLEQLEQHKCAMFLSCPSLCKV